MWIFLIVIVGLVFWSLQRKFVFDSAFGFNLLFVYDGGVKRLELDLFRNLVDYRIGDLLWLQPKKQ